MIIRCETLKIRPESFVIRVQVQGRIVVLKSAKGENADQKSGMDKL
jgi:hypothetical protein